MKTLRSNSGFSLIEVMIVLLIIGMIVAMVGPNMFASGEEAKRQKAEIDIQSLESALQMYKLRLNRYPTTEQGLEALVSAPTIDPIPRNYPEGGFINRLPEDPWDNPYSLISPGEVGAIDIFSNGPDGQPGTDDDIGNWDN
ncbi:type II secretion system major pseudopilin GspG [Alteromonas gracilis]|uniref:type II secretion system major pseudopilin GspG n=1 Tax=Alteromonas gracilis TaxID=1479524 RepID=UPI00373506DB